MRQILLSPEDLSRGLFDRVNCDIPGVNSALIARSPVHLAEEFGLTFADSFDDLDDLKIAVPEISTGVAFALIRHRGIPVAETEIWLDRADANHSGGTHRSSGRATHPSRRGAMALAELCRSTSAHSSVAVSA